jgi:hypothetical protein
VSEPPPGGDRPDVGLCAVCTHAAVQRSARGGEFWRCRAADTCPRLLRYPPLPVTGCPAFQAGRPETPSGSKSG